MRKMKKTLATVALASMVLTALPAQLFAADAPTRLADVDRVGTAIAIANNGWTSADTVVVAPADDANLVDALAVAPLAGQANAPILMTYKDSLDARVKAEISKLGAKNVYAVGALSQTAIDQLGAISGVVVTPLKGADRFETAAKIAAKLTSPKGTFVVGYNGLADAMSAASFAAANGYAIEIADLNGSLPASESLVGSTVYTLGGPSLVKDIAGAQRLYGATRYDTNDKVLGTLSYKYDKVYVANGETLVDALAGSALAAKTQSPVILTDGVSAKAAATVAKNMGSSSQVIAFGGTGVVPETVRSSIGVNQSGPLSVTSVSAVSANSFKVAFNTAPADTSKVTFTVTRASVPVSVTVTWDGASATLAAASNLPAGDYAISVKNDTTDLGTSTVSVSQQQVKTIKFTSSKLAVNTTGDGYATYQVLDQYGNDITGSYLASSIQFVPGVGTWSIPSPGVLKISPTSGTLAQFTSVTITAYDQTSGVSASVTLPTSTAVGTLSTIKLNSLTSPTNAVLTAGDTSDVWYVDYTATDMSGNSTQDYYLVTGGLIMGNNDYGTGNALTTSSPWVLANVIDDGSHKALIQVRVKDDNGQVLMDQPVTITAMSYNGVASSLNVTLKKAAMVDTITLMAPAYNIASGESKEIPYVAYDQNGNQVTKSSDLNNSTVALTGAHWVTNADGTASIYNDAVTNPGTQPMPAVITAVTKSSKLSTLTLSIQPAAVADSLSVDNSVLVSTMEVGATQQVDFGYIGGNGGLTVKDQYGRVMDMIGDPGNYEVRVTTSGAVSVSIINGTGSDTGVSGGKAFQITAAATPGPGSITFNLVDTSATPAKVIDTKTVSFSVISASDVKGYTIDKVPNPVYTAFNYQTTNSALSTANRPTDYYANPSVYGTTAGGSKVVLAGSPVTGAYTDSGYFFTNFTGTPMSYDAVKVYATKYADPAKTSASAHLTVVINDNGGLHSVTTDISSTTSGPTAASLGVSVDERTAGVTVSGDTITLDVTKYGAALQTAFLTKYMTRFNNGDGSSVSRAPVYFYAKDQYGTKAMALAQISASENDASFTLDSNGQITKLDLNALKTAGKDITITVVSTNGLLKAYKLHFK